MRATAIVKAIVGNTKRIEVKENCHKPNNPGKIDKVTQVVRT